MEQSQIVIRVLHIKFLAIRLIITDNDGEIMLLKLFILKSLYFYEITKFKVSWMIAMQGRLINIFFLEIEIMLCNFIYKDISRAIIFYHNNADVYF